MDIWPDPTGFLMMKYNIELNGQPYNPCMQFMNMLVMVKSRKYSD